MQTQHRPFPGRVTRRRSFHVFWLALALAVCSRLPAPAQTAGSQMLHGHVPAAVAGLTPLGTLAETTNLQLAIALPLRNAEALTNLLRQIYDPASPNFRHYLTPEQFAEQFGPSEADYQAVVAFARARGLAVTATHPNRVLLDVSGTVADVQKALHVTLRVYQHPVENRTFFAPDREPSLDLGVPVLHISGLDNYALPRPRYVTLPQANRQNASPNAGSGPGGTFRGNDFRAAYAPDTTLTGTGQAVGLLQFDGYSAADITYYETKAGLPAVTLTNVLLDGFSGTPTGGDGAVEVSLDIEMAISMAPGLSKVIVYEAGPAGKWHDILNRMATDNLAKQLSCSWYIPGGATDPVADQIWQQMAAQGQSFFNASGDDDAWTGLISFPGDSPYITQVGGTTLTTSGPNGGWVSETVWNWGGGTGSGGGISTQYPIPSWQTNISMTANRGSTTKRNTPDVALTADNIYVRAYGEDYDDIGGTSCAAPLWAGFAALANQQAAASGAPAIGFINPALDVIGKSPIYAAAFHDITTGNNESPISPTKFPAVAGYDLCTGWGTPAGQNLINALANPEALLITPLAGFTSSGGPGGPFTVTSQTLTLTNAGTNSLAWSLNNTSLWLNVSPAGGILLPGGPAATVTASLTATANTLPLGLATATVWFTNANDQVGQNRQFTLSVISPPNITQQPTNQAVIEGAPAAFTVLAAGGQPLAYQWQLNGTNLTDNGDLTGSATTNLVINIVSTNLAGAYTVVVTNAAGSVTSSNALLSITPSPPVFTLQPANQTVVAGETALFTVAAIGSTPFAYQWSFDGTNITDATNATLTLADVQLSQAGAYAVVLTNLYGSATSSNATLNVYTVPVINSFSPIAGPAGTVVNIAGVNFSPVAANNTVYFGAEPAVVTAASTTNLTVTVPVGETFAPITETVNGLTAEADTLFLPTFPGTGVFTNTSLASRVDLPTGTGPGWAVMADLDGDGKPDMIVNAGDHNYYIYRNISTNGTLGAGSFAPPVVLPLGNGYYGALLAADLTGDGKLDLVTVDYQNSVVIVIKNLSTPGGLTTNSFGPPVKFPCGASATGVAVGDIDGDGLPDIVTANYGSTTISVFRNLSTPGVLTTNSFAPALYFTAGPNPKNVVIADIDGDGKPDVVTANNGGTGAMSVLRNISTPGKIAFETNVVFTGLTGSYCVAVGDMDGDGKPDVVISSQNSDAVSVFRNISTPGSITTNSFAPRVDFATGGWANWVALGDLAGDGKPDLVVAVQEPSQLEVFLNTSTPGGFTNSSLAAPIIFATGSNPNTVAVGDLDGDGRPDIIFPNNYSDTVSIYQNLVSFAGPPVITSQPTNQTVALGNPVTFNVAATGTPPLNYQWEYNGTNLPGATNASLILTNIQLSQAGDYLVLVSNTLGAAVSSNALLTVLTQPPTITTQPVSQTNYVGSTVSFSVTAGGSTPLSYQWILNTTNLPGATNATLTLTDLQLNQSGNYEVVVTNAYGATNSAIAVLTVNPLPPCAPVSLGMADWWSAEGNANDNVGTNTGILVGGASYAPGEVGQAFLFDGDSGYVSIPDSPSLDSFVTNITIEAWIKVNQTTPNLDWRGIVTKGTSSWRLQGVPYAGTVDFAASGSSTDDVYGTRNVNDGQWHHVAGVYDGTNLYLYVDGTLDVSQPSTGLISQNNSPMYIGNTAGSVAPYFFNGLVDEVSLFNRALSAAEIQSIYLTGVGGKCPVPLVITSQPTNEMVSAGSTATLTVTATGMQPLNYQWNFNGTNLAWATNGLLTLTSVQPVNGGVYSVTVTNLYGLVTSSNAVLTVLTQPPTITTQPASQTNYLGSTLDFSVTAGGSMPLTYQWSFNTTNLPGATNATLTLTNVQLSQAGDYSVLVTNTYGSTNSANAVLTVISELSCEPPPSGIVSWYTGNGNANDVIGTNNGTLVGGASYTNGEVGQAFLFDGSSGYVSIPNSPSLDQFVTNITVETWIKVNQTNANSNWRGIVTKGNTSWRLQGVGSAGTLDFAASGSSTDDVVGTRNVNDGQWHHVAGVYDGTNLYLYVDGTLDVSQPSTGLITQNTSPVCIGNTYNAPAAYYFNGLIDEVSLYNRALSANEILAIYNAGSSGKCLPMQPTIISQPTNQLVAGGGAASFSVTATGSTPLSYQWMFNGTNILAGTNTTLLLTNVQSSQAGMYAVWVTNQYGSILSSNALLAVLGPPVITQQPAGETNLPGSTATFTVTATGLQPLSYQWLFDGVPVSGSPVITTVAGNYSLGGGYSGDGGAATNAALNYAADMVVDGTSNLYIDDSHNDVIRKVNGNGIITTVAGKYNLGGGYSGDGGMATNAALNSPVTVAVDSAGNLYIADNGNNVIRKVNTNGIITTVAGSYSLGGGYSGDGGAATNAALNQPHWVVVDGTGNLYLSEGGNNVVRKVNAAGIISTVAGKQSLGGGYSGDGGAATNAALSNPVGITVDGAGNLFIAEYGNNVIRKVDATGTITTVAGNYNLGGVYAGDGGPAVKAGLGNPIGVRLDGWGNLYIGDTHNYVIRRVAAANFYANLTNGTLTITNVQNFNAGSYQVVVSNALGAVTSSNAVLAILSLPVITAQPTNETVTAGNTATFSVTANGVLPLNYQWRFNGTNILGATNTTLLLTNVQVSQAGNYAVWVTNQYGAILSSNALLTVLGPPIITQQPASETNLIGTTATFTVIATGSQPLGYQWFFDGNPISGIPIITTVAGKQNLGGGYSGDGGAATNAGLSYPADVVLDGAGNLYIADALNCVIRKISTTGTISTVAGKNSLGGGYSGDGGAATNAALYNPTSITLDGQGNLYIADSRNNVIRMVNTSGIISTVAGKSSLGGGYSGDGGTATNAALSDPYAVRVDTTGNLYIADTGNNVIRKVITGGIITTVAGNHSLGGGYSGDGGAATNAALNQPHGVVVDGTGNLYLSEGGNNVVRKVNAAGIISTVAGKKSLGGSYSGDGGAATNAALNNPTGITMDGAGNLFIAEYGNNVIRKVNAAAIISTLAGNHSLGGGYSGDGGAATNAALNNPAGVGLDSYGNLYIDDVHNNVIRKVAAAIPNATLTNGTLTITNVQIYDAGTYQVIVSNAVGAVTSSNAMLAVLTLPVITAQPTNETVTAGNTATFSVTANGVLPLNYQWRFNGTNILGGTNTTLLITNVQVSQAGNYAVWVTNQYGAILSSNALLTVLGPPIITQQPVSGTNSVGTTATFTVTATGSQPLGYQWFFDGNPLGGSPVISTVAGNHSLGASYSGDGGMATNAGLNYAADVALDGAGNLYIADSFNFVIRKVSVGGTISTVAGNHGLGRGYSGDGGAATNATLNYPDGVAVDGQGALYISDSVNNLIRKVNASGIITTVAGNARLGAGYSGDGGAATNAALSYPYAIRMDAAGNLYIADDGNEVIRKVSTNGIITTVAGNHSVGYTGDGGPATNAALNEPNALAFDGAGNLYFSEGNNNIVRKVNSAGIITTVAGNKTLGGGYSGDGGPATNAAFNNPVGITFDNAGNLYIAEYGNNVVRKVDATGTISTVIGNHALGGGYSGDGAAATNAALYNPLAVLLDGLANLYVTDGHNNVVRKVAGTIPNATTANGTLTITNVQAYDAGTYQVIVTNAVGAVTSSNAVLTVLGAPPTIAQNPGSETNVAGTTASFTAAANGAPPLAYQWQKNGLALNNGGNVSGAATPNLTLANVQDADAASYALVVTNLYGSITSSPALLVVLDPPMISLQPTNEVVTLGSNTTFSVTAAGSAPLLYQWAFNGTNISAGTNASLTLTNVQLWQAGSYAVWVTNSAGSILSSNAVLTVNSAPSIVPVISAFSPLLGGANTVVNLTGLNFSPVAASNTVYFGAVQAVVTAASTTNLTVTVPVAATFAPITETVNGMTAFSSASFLPVFAGTGVFSNTSLAGRIDLPTGNGPGMVVMADLDGDGKPDLIVNTGDHNLYIYRNISTNGSLGAGSFAPPVVLPLGNGYCGSMQAADLTGDGKLDLVTVDYQNSVVIVVQNLSTPGGLTTNSFGAPVTFPCGASATGVAVADIDGDGLPDIVTANYGSTTISVLRNLGTPGAITTNSFAPALYFTAGPNPKNVAIVDIDGDGKPDVVTANNGGNGSMSVLRNLSTPGNIAFQTNVVFTGLAGSYCVAVGDLDGDGKPDVVIAAQNDEAVSVFRNISTPGSITTNSFAPRVDFATGGWANWVAIGDVTGDGKPDLVVAVQLPSQLEVFQNTSTPGSFTSSSLAAPVIFPTGNNPNTVAVGDLDGDGRPDIAFPNNYSGTVSVYQNVMAAGPVITAQPVSLTDAVFTTAAFSVTANGSQPINYQWTFNGTNVSGGTNAMLTLTNLQVWQAGNYAVWVTNPYGSLLSSNALLTVVAPPVITQNPAGQTNLAGTTASFAAAANGTAPLTYQWQKNGAPLNNGGNVAGAATTNLSLANVQDADAAAYAIVVTNLYGSVTSTPALLVVLDPPVILAHPANEVVTVSSNVAFSVTVASSSPLAYQWTFNGTNLPGGTNAMLTLTNVPLWEAGNYAVWATNAAGSVLSSNATLTVNPLFQFVWNRIPSPRFATAPFTVVIQAQNFPGGLATNFSSAVTLQATNGIPILPTVSGNFIQGVWTGAVTVAQTATNLVLSAQDSWGETALANPINIVNLPVLTTVASDDSLLFFWPTNPSGFVLETTPQLVPATWVPVPAEPFPFDGQNLLAVPTSGTNAFFRLRFPGP